MDAAVAAVFTERCGIFTVKEERVTLKALIGGKGVFDLLLTDFFKGLVKHYTTRW